MRREKGFTLIELLIVVAIIGIIAAIAIPNLLNALNRGRQKRTMADMRTIATGMEQYAVDNNFYPVSVTINTVGNYIAPTYLKVVPKQDGWNHNYELNTDDAGSGYTIWSYAKDNAKNSTVTLGKRTTDFNEDIVYSNGQFIQWPEGIQQ